jgi:hypothetical protein
MILQQLILMHQNLLMIDNGYEFFFCIQINVLIQYFNVLYFYHAFQKYVPRMTIPQILKGRTIFDREMSRKYRKVNVK